MTVKPAQSTIFDPPLERDVAESPKVPPQIVPNGEKVQLSEQGTAAAEHAPPVVWDWLAGYVAGQS